MRTPCDMYVGVILKNVNNFFLGTLGWLRTMKLNLATIAQTLALADVLIVYILTCTVLISARRYILSL